MTITETELRGKIVAACKAASQSSVARDLDISRAYMSDIVTGKRRISTKIAKHFGYEVAYQQMKVDRNYRKIKGKK